MCCFQFVEQHIFLILLTVPMKKIITLLLSVFAFSIPMNAAMVSLEKATLVAENFMASKSQNSIKPILIHEEINSGETVFYIFGFEKPGFVIIAAEDNVYPVLGYSVNENFNLEEIPVQLKSWLQFYTDQIQYVTKNNIPADSKISEGWKRLITGNHPVSTENSKSISPLLPCNWDQGQFYNELCPKDNGGDGGHVWVGCVATAMAQVMFYYRYPQTGQGSHSYTHSQYGVQSANFGNTTYEWNGMLNQLGTSNFPVATISYHAAVSINMDFGADGSGANTGSVPSALVNYFGYDQSAYFHQKFFYSNSAWLDLLRSNLDLKHPVLYSGNPNNGEAGHCWVIDGYQNTDYFHCNWGWSGSSNGYYYVDALNPAAGGTNFNYGQGAVFNIFPASTYPTYCNGQTLVTNTTGTLEDGSWEMPYQPSSNCSWLIKPTDSINGIKLTFHRFETELNDDVMTVYGGETTAAPIIGTFSGSTLPSTVTSATTSILITFTTDADNEASGWYLTYSSTLPVYCGNSSYTDPTGTITDGSGNREYQSNTTCTWIIEPTGAAAVKLTFTSFDLEQGNDYLRVYDLGTQSLLATLTGSTLPQEFIANSGSFYLEFRTNSSVQKQGWEANYKTLGVGIDENPFLSSLSVYPLPVNDILMIKPGEIISGQINTEIFSIDGKLKDFSSVYISGSDEIKLDVSNLSSGIYFLRLTGKDGSRTIKISIE